MGTSRSVLFTRWGRRSGSIGCCAGESERCFQFTETPPGSQVFPPQRSRPGKPFGLPALPLLPPRQRTGQCFELAASINPSSWLCMKTTSDQTETSYLRQPDMNLCVSLYRCTSLYLSINLLIPLPRSSFERCPVLVQRAFRLVPLLWSKLFNRRTLRLTVLDLSALVRLLCDFTNVMMPLNTTHWSWLSVCLCCLVFLFLLSLHLMHFFSPLLIWWEPVMCSNSGAADSKWLAFIFEIPPQKRIIPHLHTFLDPCLFVSAL